MIATDKFITSVEALEALYEKPAWAAVAKETDTLVPAYRAFVEAAPYVTLATAGADGVNCSPRGDAPGFVRVHDDRTLLIPDRPGNNRIETLRNLVEDPRIALHFLVPGCDETLRIKGRARISVDPALLAGFAVDGRSPRTVIVVDIERVYFHCAKALRRSKLWDATRHIARERLPSVNAMLAAVQWRRCRDVLQNGIRRKTTAVPPPETEPHAPEQVPL